MARSRKPSGDRRKKPRSIDRKKGNRQPRKTILIVCEGQETEPKYFKSFKLHSVHVTVKGGDGRTAAVQVVNRAIELREKRRQESKLSFTKSEYEEVWCVFDSESAHANPSFVQAATIATQCDLHLGVSNPSFEYWYLLHFEETTRSFLDAAEVIGQLKKYVPEYEKSANVFALLQPMTATAIKRAKGILKNHPDKDEPRPNPSTYVHKLVEQLID